MRCFIGFILPEDCKERIFSLQQKMKNLPMRAKFVEKENLHICFSFLGEIDENRIQEVKKKIDEISSKYKKVDVASKGILFIPNKNYFRVLALDIKVGKEKLTSISNEIVQKIGGDSKPPHITLCRVKSVWNKEELFKFARSSSFEIKFTVDSIQLIKSILSREGPKYTIIHSSKLL